MPDSDRTRAFRTADALQGARLVAPLAVGSLAYGVVYGALAATRGLTFLQATTMSATLFAGSAQLVVLTVWADPLPIALVTLTALVVNVRLFLYGATLAPTLEPLPSAYRRLSAFFLTDETFALAAADQRQDRPRPGLVLGAGLVLWTAWVGGSMVGHVAGGHVPDPAAWGLDFVFVAAFVGLLALMEPDQQDALPWAVAAVVAIVVDHVVPGPWYVVAGGLAGSVVGAVRPADLAS